MTKLETLEKSWKKLETSWKKLEKLLLILQTNFLEHGYNQLIQFYPCSWALKRTNELRSWKHLKKLEKT